MSDEIDEFIRRAAERRKQQGQGQRRPAQRPPAPAAPQASPQSTQRPRPRTLEPEVLEAEVIEDVSSTVTRHLDTRQFEQRASHMGEEAGLADDRVEARLHQTFDHKLGRLAQTVAGAPATATIRSATDNAAAVTTAAANDSLLFLISALSTPQNLRQAVILSEILARPEHQW